MMTLKRKLWSAALMLAVVGSMTACDDDDPEVEILQPLAGYYEGSETCAPYPAGSPYIVELANAASGGNNVVLYNIYGIENRNTGVVEGNTITVPSQPYEYHDTAGHTYVGTLSATGTINGDEMKLHFVLTGDLEDDCNFVGTRNFLHPQVGG